MDTRTETTATLTQEDIIEAIAQYASQAHAGEWVFDAHTVEFLDRDGEPINLEINARVTTN